MMWLGAGGSVGPASSLETQLSLTLNSEGLNVLCLPKPRIWPPKFPVHSINREETEVNPGVQRWGMGKERGPGEMT